MLTLPPGIIFDGTLEEVANGGENVWLPYDRKKLYTNAFIIRNGKLLLGYKKRGFGKGLYNGFGGKVDPGETPAQAALRELKEESGITAPLEHCGVLFFVVPDIDHAFHIDIFRAEEYDGTIIETEEMRPQWFALPNADAPTQDEQKDLQPIPFDHMWKDDVYWMPLLLASRHFLGRADFDTEGNLKKWWFGAVPQTPVDSR
ncbi:7,8-dihydro-8-oxoguanine triphosphatase [Grifola frondosa]|uniref:Oxidized purine nucleoside triphosphate hydrolase n=1 Tax=Grifola frondosa TaxID=5627 RepID=A0A1C7MLK8_GRIFR|nr:7,8-dihydro-8-oxoguanine triphosphatase [Grifola frondosa]